MLIFFVLFETLLVFLYSASSLFEAVDAFLLLLFPPVFVNAQGGAFWSLGALLRLKWPSCLAIGHLAICIYTKNMVHYADPVSTLLFFDLLDSSLVDTKCTQGGRQEPLGFKYM